MNVVRSAITDCDAVAGQEAREVQPVRADVADHAQVAAELALQAPAPVGVVEQPVLQEAAGDEPDLPRSPAGDRRARVQVLGIEALVEVDGVDAARWPVASSSSSPVCALVIASGFSHTTCLPAASTARTCSSCRWLGVARWTTSTRSSASIASKARTGPAGSPRAPSRPAPLVARADDAGDLDAEPPQRLDVDDADESRPRDRRADVPE